MTSLCVTENWDRLMERGVDVLLVDDHEVVRAGYRRLLEATNGIAVIAEAEKEYEWEDDDHAPHPTPRHVASDEQPRKDGAKDRRRDRDGGG